MYNTIITACHLVADPTSSSTPSGKTVCKMRACISNNAAKTKCFIDVETWDKQAELCAKYLKKGREVLFQGELCMDSWEKDGKTMNKYYIRASSFQFLGGNPENKKDESASMFSQKTNTADSLDSSEDIPF